MSTLKLKQHTASCPGGNGGGCMFSFLPVVLIPSKVSTCCCEECKDLIIAGVMCCGPVSINPRLLSCILTVTYIFLPNLHHLLLSYLLHYLPIPTTPHTHSSCIPYSVTYTSQSPQCHTPPTSGSIWPSTTRHFNLFHLYCTTKNPAGVLWCSNIVSWKRHTWLFHLTLKNSRIHTLQVGFLHIPHDSIEHSLSGVRNFCDDCTSIILYTISELSPSSLNHCLLLQSLLLTSFQV